MSWIARTAGRRACQHGRNSQPPDLSECAAPARRVLHETAGPVIEQVGRGDRGLGGVQVDLRDLAISIYIGLLMNAPNTLEGANREGVLRSQMAGMGRLDLAAGCIIQLFLFQGLDLCLGRDTTFFGDFGLQRLQAGFDVRQIMAQPDRPHA